MNVESDKRIQIADIEDLITTESLNTEPYQNIRNSESKCSCSGCSKLCKNIPGFFDPLGFLYYLVKLANSTDPMKVFATFESIIDNIQQDFWSSGPDEILMLRPRTIKEIAGHHVKFNIYSITSKCIYLGSGGCSLSDDTRPSECRCAYNCHTSKYKFEKRQMSEQWNSPLGRALNELYDSIGKKKYENEFMKDDDSALDMMMFAVEALKRI
jgi:hypothetical protein